MKYYFQVKTGDEYLAGTDSNIFIILEGEKGMSEEKRMNGYISGNAFERNQMDKFTIDFDTDVGRVFQIKLRSDMRYAGAGWLLSYITIERKGSDAPLSNVVSRFNVNEWIEDKKTRQYTVPYEDWNRNLLSYETEVREYKVYPITVPANGTFQYKHTEKKTTEFTYASSKTKTTTKEFNESLDLKASYQKNKQIAEKLTDVKNYEGYLKFAFKQGVSDSEVNEMIQKENKEIIKEVTSTLTNPDNHERKYEAVFYAVRVNAIVSTGGVAALFSGDRSIEFGGFRKISS